jgi:pyruvate dehydrogenase E2 component (dihydrolipoamide acetyltransferase)
MAYVFNFPDVGEGIHEGRVVEWLVAEGATVAEDQPLVKVETDKAVVELPSPRAGVVIRLHCGADTVIHVGDPLVTIGSSGERVADAAPVAPAPERAAAPRHVVAAEAQAAPSRRPLATPRTRALARKLGVDLSAVAGTGSGGRVTDEDVSARRVAMRWRSRRLPPRPPSPASSARASSAADQPPEEGDRGAMRVKQTAAHVTHVDEADVTELHEHYRRVKPVIEAQAGVKFSLLPFFIKALITALKRHPIFNASVDEAAQEILLKRSLQHRHRRGHARGPDRAGAQGRRPQGHGHPRRGGRGPRRARAHAATDPRRAQGRDLHHHQHRPARRGLRDADHQPARARDRRPAQDQRPAGGGRRRSRSAK